jgi:hypothetical protein
MSWELLPVLLNQMQDTIDETIANIIRGPAMPTMFAVQSSTITAIGYSAKKSELHIIFVGNHEYVYRDFPADLWEQFRKAESVGRFFAQSIKKKFHGEKLS